MGYADKIKETLLENIPITLSIQNGKTFFVTIHNDIDVQQQPFWIAIDQIFKWTFQGLMPDTTLLEGGLVIFDFGSKTFNQCKLVNNLILDEDSNVSASIGTWDIVKDTIQPEIIRQRQARGIATGDVRWQELMDVYESGDLKIGKHELLNVSTVLDEAIHAKVQQRLKEADAKLSGGKYTRTMICAGGDVENNLSAFEKMYNNNIVGEFRVAVDEHGNPEPKYRQRDGLLKGAIRTWASSLS
jgi:hypothetical protein